MKITKKQERIFKDKIYDYMVSILNKKQEKQVVKFIVSKTTEIMTAHLVFDELINVAKAWDSAFGKKKEKKNE